MSDAELAQHLAAVRAEARRRVPEWQPWMRDWCTETNWGATEALGARTEAGRFASRTP